MKKLSKLRQVLFNYIYSKCRVHNYEWFEPIRSEVGLQRALCKYNNNGSNTKNVNDTQDDIRLEGTTSHIL